MRFEVFQGPEDERPVRLDLAWRSAVRVIAAISNTLGLLSPAAISDPRSSGLVAAYPSTVLENVGS